MQFRDKIETKMVPSFFSFLPFFCDILNLLHNHRLNSPLTKQLTREKKDHCSTGDIDKGVNNNEI